jgi:hypothetical protein
LNQNKIKKKDDMAIQDRIVGINQKLYQGILDNYGQYSLNTKDLSVIKQFLATPINKTDRRITLAKKICNLILKRHAKDELVKIGVASLADIEGRVAAIQARIRDHVIHSVFTFLLGVYLIDKLMLTVSPFEWKLSALLHDIGYPFEMAIHLPGKIRDKLKRYSRKLKIYSPELKWSWKFENLEKLTGEPSSVELIDDRLEQLQLGCRSTTLYNDMMVNGDMDHGIVSALLLLKITDMIYRAHNQNFQRVMEPIDGVDYSYKHFDKHIINAATAILLHNIDRTVFNSDSLDFSNQRHYIAALLRLSDEFQDWERPSIGRTVYLASDYDIHAEYYPAKKIEFTMPNNRAKDLKWIESFFDGIQINIISNVAVPETEYKQAVVYN